MKIHLRIVLSGKHFVSFVIFCSDLSDPGMRCVFLPTMSNGMKLRLVQWPRFEQFSYVRTPQRGVGQLVQVDGGQVCHQLVELAQRLGLEGAVHPLVEFLGGQPAGGVVLAQHRGDAVAIRVRGADSRVTRHLAPS